MRFFYTRSWRDDAIRPVLEAMSQLPNCRAWYSCDRGTGIPASIPPRVRLAWLMTGDDDAPPPETHLIFRIRALRRRPQTRIQGVRVCPAEDGVTRKMQVTCDRCRLCWRSLSADPQHRISLPLIQPP